LLYPPDQQRHPEPFDGFQFVGHVPDACVVRNSDAVMRTAVLQPLLIGPFLFEQVTMAFHGNARVGQDAGELLSQVAVGEVDAAHAARA
jgi:hypothetical protein